MRTLASSGRTARTATLSFAVILVAIHPGSAPAQRPVPCPAGAVVQQHRASAAPIVAVNALRVSDPTPPLSPRRAAILSGLVPGAGQAYAGEGRRALGIFGVAATGLALGIASNNDTGNVGVIVSLGAYLYGIIDAPASVHRAEARAEQRRRTPVAN